MMENRYIDVQGFAKILGVPKSWVYERSRRNAIPIMRRLGKYVRFDAELLPAWVKEGCPESWDDKSA